MANEADVREAEKPNQIGTSGDVDIGGSTGSDDPQIKQDATSFGGRFLRFTGMGIIVGVILFALFISSTGGLEPGLFIGLLAIGLAGAAMHYKGRKLAPGKHGASILGGILGGVTSSAVLIILMLMIFAMFVDGCEDFFGV